jgi:hypothetical protein
MSKALYQATATRSGEWWAISVPALRGVHSQVRRFREAEEAVAEAIALHQDVGRSTFTVVVSAVLGDVLDKKIRNRRDLVRRVEDLQHELGFASVEVLTDMAELGLSQRDAADVLGISFQRVGQLWPR